MSDWTHSRYVRHLADAAFGGRPVRIDLSVRRLYCENGSCPKVTFAEQVPGLTVRYQRRTPLLQHLVESVGVVLAGRGGARMLRVLNVRLSQCTVLSQLMRVPLPPVETPRVLGVDDFALYGGTYATLLVDATTRLPLTLWEGRDAQQLSHWLREHPGVEVACRDGSLTYRQGITTGAPDATQVSDRFHLWQGLSRRVQDIASAHRGCLAAALPPDRETGPARVEETVENTTADTRAGRHARRLFGAVQALTRTGRSDRVRGEALRRAGNGRTSEPETPPTFSDQLISTSQVTGEPHIDTEFELCTPNGILRANQPMHVSGKLWDLDATGDELGTAHAGAALMTADDKVAARITSVQLAMRDAFVGEIAGISS